MSNVKTSNQNSKLKLVFFGNTKYSIIGLKIVYSIFPVSLVITIPDSPVKKLASELNIPTLETSKLDKEVINKIAKLKSDFLVVEDYGLILSKDLLTLPKYAPLNIHHSLLPKYRGPSPAPTAILNGDKISGVTIIQITDEVDSGDILAQQEYILTPKETRDTLLTKLNELGGQLILKVIKQYLEGSINPTPQDHSKATYTKHFVKEDGYFNINNPPQPEKLDREIRAYYPWPGVWTKWNNKIIKFLPPIRYPKQSEESSRSMEDSSLIAQNDRKDEHLLQMEGKKPISFKDFLNGYPDFPLKQLLRTRLF